MAYALSSHANNATRLCGEAWHEHGMAGGRGQVRQARVKHDGRRLEMQDKSNRGDC